MSEAVDPATKPLSGSEHGFFDAVAFASEDIELGQDVSNPPGTCLRGEDHSDRTAPQRQLSLEDDTNTLRAPCEPGEQSAGFSVYFPGMTGDQDKWGGKF